MIFRTTSSQAAGSEAFVPAESLSVQWFGSIGQKPAGSDATNRDFLTSVPTPLLNARPPHVFPSTPLLGTERKEMRGGRR